MRGCPRHLACALATCTLCALTTACQANGPPVAMPGDPRRAASILPDDDENVVVESTGESASGFPDVPPAMNVRTSVLDALQDRDRRLGLGTGGPAVSVVVRDARGSDAPESIAELQALVDGGGAVRRVIVLGTTAGRAEWERVASQIESDLSGVTLPVPPGVDAVVVRLRVVVAMRMPSGALAHPTPVMERALKTRDEERVPPPAACAGAEAPSGADLFGHLTPSVCAPPGHVQGQFDVSDLGATPARAAHAIVLEERVVSSR